LGSYLTTVFLIAHDSLASAMPERIVSQQHHSVAVVSYRTGISARSGSQSRTRILWGGGKRTGTEFGFKHKLEVPVKGNV